MMTSCRAAKLPQHQLLALDTAREPKPRAGLGGFHYSGQYLSRCRIGPDHGIFAPGVYAESTESQSNVGDAST